MIHRMRQLFRREEGTASIEFIIVFPVIMWFVLTIFETGFVAARMVLLEHGLDRASREIRIGSFQSTSHDKLRDKVCEYSRILMNCKRDLVLEVVEMDLGSAYPQNQANCIDRTGEIEPKITYQPGGRNRIMFIRACMVIDPLFPTMGITLGLQEDASGGLQIVAYTAFMNEPP